MVKSYYCDGFERVAAACPVPIVIAGGKKLPEPEVLEMAYKAIQEGAHGVDMGRNIFQSDCPAGMGSGLQRWFTRVTPPLRPSRSMKQLNISVELKKEEVPYVR